MPIGREQRYHPGYSRLEKAYIGLIGMPIVGLRIRARNVFSLIPKHTAFRHIMDMGSGTGVFSFELGRRYPHARVLGVDPKEEAVAACRHIAERMGMGNVDFRCSSIEDLQDDKMFDLILCIDIIEHIEDDLGALRRLYTKSAEGGFLVLHVPALHRRYPVWKKHLNFDVETHIRIGYEIEDVVHKVDKAGFSVTTAGYTYGFWETLANNIGYMITQAKMKNKMLYSMVFPVLNALALLGVRARPRRLGAGVFVVAQKGHVIGNENKAV